MSIASRIAQLTRRAASAGPGAACADCPSMAVVYEDEDRPDQIQPQPTCATCGRPVANVVTICYVDGDDWRRAQ